MWLIMFNIKIFCIIVVPINLMKNYLLNRRPIRDFTFFKSDQVTRFKSLEPKEKLLTITWTETIYKNLKQSKILLNMMKLKNRHQNL